jgi:hypothetical protein
MNCPHCGFNVAYHTASCPAVPTRLERLTHEQALEMTSGDDRQFIIDHPGQTYRIYRDI